MPAVAVHHCGAVLQGSKRRWRGKSSVAAPRKADYVTSQKLELPSTRYSVPLPKEFELFKQGLRANRFIKDERRKLKGRQEGGGWRWLAG